MTPKQYAWSAVDIVIDLARENGIKYRRGDFEFIEESVDIVTESEKGLVRGRNLVAPSLLGIVVALQYDFQRTKRKLKERKYLFAQYTCCTAGAKGIYFKFSCEELGGDGPYEVRYWPGNAEDPADGEGMVVGGCTSCICRDCALWWANRCPYGNCYDDHRAKVKPYDVSHPGRPPRTGWSNWYKDQAFWCRGGAFYPCKGCEHYVPYERGAQTRLFDFTEEKRGLESRGYPSAWVDEVVDRTDKHAIFERNGKPHYKSQCPYYEGYWLRGGLGSVQCAAHDGLIPGLQWDKFCSKCHEKCLVFREAEGASSLPLKNRTHRDNETGCEEE